MSSYCVIVYDVMIPVCVCVCDAIAASLSQSCLVSVRNEPRASSVVSSDGSIQAASNSARGQFTGSVTALTACLLSIDSMSNKCLWLTACLQALYQC